MALKNYMLHKSKKSRSEENKMKNDRFLISINILGSAGPIRFVVNERDLVSGVIDTALKTYTREGRLPVLGSDVNNFLLYCATAGSGALSPSECIGSHRGRNFVLWKKKSQTLHASITADSERVSQNQKGSAGWKTWINKSLSVKHNLIRT